MGLREKLNRSPAVASTVVVVVLVAGGVYAYRGWQATNPHGSIQAYYTVDDGQTFFADDSKKVTPFDHNGQPAVRAHVFDVAGKRSVGYLEKMDAKAAEVAHKVFDRKPTDPPIPMAEMMASLAGHQYKRPGEKAWVSGADPKAVNAVKDVRGPNGQQLIEVDE